MRVLIDTNVALTYLTRREDPYTEEADEILRMCSDEVLEGAIALHSLSTIWYKARKLQPEKVRAWIRLLCILLTVSGADNRALLAAIDDESFSDFEDAMQDCCASSFSADYIITANLKDFAGKSKIPALTPKEFLELVHNSGQISDLP